VTDVVAAPGPAPALVLSLDSGRGHTPSRRRGLGLAPATVLVAVLVINVCAMSTPALVLPAACAVLVFTGLATLGRPRLFWGGLAALAACLAVFAVPLPGPLGLLSAVGFWTFRFGVAILAGAYLLLTVQPGELAATLYRARFPRWLTTPLVVMVRFFPQAGQEFRAVLEAIALRGIPVGPAAWVLHPLRTVEYLLVPMLASCSRIADDLAASALVRGLGSACRPTPLGAVRLGWRDAVAGVALAAVVVLALSRVNPLP
jgi:energy-coupling factor transport system permease protein